MKKNELPSWSQQCEHCEYIHEFFATLAEGGVVEGPILCNSCEDFERGYKEGHETTKSNPTLKDCGINLRPVREVTQEEENFRTEPVPGMNGACVIRRDPVKPEPLGSIVLIPFRISEYNPDCDGSLMAEFECLDVCGEPTGWTSRNHGLHPDVDLVVEDGIKGLRKLWRAAGYTSSRLDIVEKLEEVE